MLVQGDAGLVPDGELVNGQARRNRPPRLHHRDRALTVVDVAAQQSQLAFDGEERGDRPAAAAHLDDGGAGRQVQVQQARATRTRIGAAAPGRVPERQAETGDVAPVVDLGAHVHGAGREPAAQTRCRRPILPCILPVQHGRRGANLYTRRSRDVSVPAQSDDDDERGRGDDTLAHLRLYK